MKNLCNLLIVVLVFAILITVLIQIFMQFQAFDHFLGFLIFSLETSQKNHQYFGMWHCAVAHCHYFFSEMFCFEFFSTEFHLQSLFGVLHSIFKYWLIKVFFLYISLSSSSGRPCSGNKACYGCLITSTNQLT